MQLINKVKFVDLYATFDSFNNGVITPANSYLKDNNEIVDEANQFISDNYLYQVLFNHFSTRQLKYGVDSSRYFINAWLDAKVGLWSKLLPFIQNELGQLKEAAKRGDIEVFNSTSKATHIPNLTTTTNTGRSDSPTASSGDITFKVDDNVSEKGMTTNIQTGNNEIDSTISSNRDIQDIYKNTIKIIESKISLNIGWFVDQFKDLFIYAMANLSSNSYEDDVFGPIGYRLDGRLISLLSDLKDITIDGVNYKWDFSQGKLGLKINEGSNTGKFGDGTLTSTQPKAVNTQEFNEIASIPSLLQAVKNNLQSIEEILNSLTQNLDIPKPIAETSDSTFSFRKWSYDGITDFTTTGTEAYDISLKAMDRTTILRWVVGQEVNSLYDSYPVKLRVDSVGKVIIMDGNGIDIGDYSIEIIAIDKVKKEGAVVAGGLVQVASEKDFAYSTDDNFWKMKITLKLKPLTLYKLVAKAISESTNYGTAIFDVFTEKDNKYTNNSNENMAVLTTTDDTLDNIFTIGLLKNDNYVDSTNMTFRIFEIPTKTT